MDSEPLSKLKKQLDIMKSERDILNTDVLEERAKLAKIEAEFAKRQSECLRARESLDEKESMLEKFNFTLRESENTYTKLLLNTDRLFSALEKESNNLRKANNL
jgi:chromosome segregation ATPase